MNDSTVMNDEKKIYVKPTFEKASDHPKDKIVKVITREQTSITEKANSTLDKLVISEKNTSSQPEPIAEKIKKDDRPSIKVRFTVEDVEEE